MRCLACGRVSGCHRCCAAAHLACLDICRQPTQVLLQCPSCCDTITKRKFPALIYHSKHCHQCHRHPSHEALHAFAGLMKPSGCRWRLPPRRLPFCPRVTCCRRCLPSRAALPAHSSGHRSSTAYPVMLSCLASEDATATTLFLAFQSTVVHILQGLGGEWLPLAIAPVDMPATSHLSSVAQPGRGALLVAAAGSQLLSMSDRCAAATSCDHSAAPGTLQAPQPTAKRRMHTGHFTCASLLALQAAARQWQ